nr:triose-phosphate isomerase [Candidatus Peregrinibacteria bacterium]
MIVVNFKTYEGATGEKALELARIHQKVAAESSVEIIICVQPTDIFRISQEVKISVFAQHIDPQGYGSNTGFITPEAAKLAGASGTLLNHSEHLLLDESVLEESIKRAREEIGLKTIVCTATVEKGAQIEQDFHPDFIAVEPPELIGGDVSVSTANPEIIEKAVNLIGGDKVLVGAG